MVAAAYLPYSIDMLMRMDPLLSHPSQFLLIVSLRGMVSGNRCFVVSRCWMPSLWCEAIAGPFGFDILAADVVAPFLLPPLSVEAVVPV